MTPSASPYAVFKAEEWVSGVGQPIGIDQCLRLTSKKLSPIRFSVKKKSCNSFRKGFFKNHVQLAFVWHVNILLSNDKHCWALLSCHLQRRCIPLEIIWFHDVSFEWCIESKRLVSVQRWLRLLLDEFPCKDSYAIFDQNMSSMSFTD